MTHDTGLRFPPFAFGFSFILTPPSASPFLPCDDLRFTLE